MTEPDNEPMDKFCTEKQMLTYVLVSFIAGTIIGAAIVFPLSMQMKQQESSIIADKVERLLAEPHRMFRYDLIEDVSVDDARKLYFAYAGYADTGMRHKGQARQILEGVLYDVCYGELKDPTRKTIPIDDQNVSMTGSMDCLLTCLDHERIDTE